ncbi:MAG: DedA family protein [Caldilineaceae bacterium]
MEFIQQAFGYLLHFDEYLKAFVEQYQAWTYLLLFLIIFAETGLVFTPFLPGDSLLFAAGAMAALGWLNLWILIPLLIIAAILGDTVNYWVGHWFGATLFDGRFRMLKPEYLERTNRFYTKHGGKTIILARFVPIVRTFAPFVAGMGAMDYRKFFTYNVIGGVAWVLIFTLLGYFFGNLPFVEANFELVVIAIVILSVLPAVYEAIAERRRHQRELADAALPAGSPAASGPDAQG